MAGEPQSQVAVDVELVFGPGLTQDGDHVAESLDDGDDSFLREAVRAVDVRCLLDSSVFAFGALALGLRFGDPGGDHGRVRAGVQHRPVAGQLGVARRDGRAVWSCPCGGSAGGFLVDELGGGVPASQRAELLDQPRVERPDEVVLAQEDVAGMMDVVGQGVLLRLAAPVVGDAVRV